MRLFKFFGPEDQANKITINRYIGQVENPGEDQNFLLEKGPLIISNALSFRIKNKLLY